MPEKNGHCYAWVGADAGYGKGPAFCVALDRMGEQFVIDLHSDFRDTKEPSKPYIPEKTHRRGRKPTRYKIDEESITVEEVIDQMGLGSQPVLQLRDTTHGKLKYGC